MKYSPKFLFSTGTGNLETWVELLYPTCQGRREGFYSRVFHQLSQGTPGCYALYLILNIFSLETTLKICIRLLIHFLECLMVSKCKKSEKYYRKKQHRFTYFWQKYFKHFIDILTTLSILYERLNLFFSEHQMFIQSSYNHRNW